MPVPLYTTIALDKSNPGLVQEINQACNTNVDMCLECGKCSGGCSNAHVFDFTPRKIVKLIKLGYENTLLHMEALWGCVACHLCVDRCPAGIDTPRIIDYLREKAYRQGIKPSREKVALFYELMLASIAKRGRVAELPLMINFNLRTGQYLKDASLGIRMLIKGKLNPIPARVRQISEVRSLFLKNPLKRERQKA